MSTRSEKAWADFWSRGGAGPESGCLPKGLAGIDAEQRRIWGAVAEQMPPGASVLDLATGDGAVLGKLRSRRSDLKMTGVDSSAVLPKGVQGAKLIPKVAMESLPFRDGSFDLVTSQFGFEYGDTGRIAAEVRRVLRPDGRYAFIIHHAEGAIVAHNRGRAEVLRAALGPGGVHEKAVALAKARQLAPLPTPPFFFTAPEDALRQFPGQDVGQEYAAAVLQTLEMGRRRHPRETLEVLDALKGKAENEISRIEALREAARDANGIAALCDQLRAAGLSAGEPEVLRERLDALPFGWHVAGRPAAAD
jgi:SAM-dependent methyltransferase